MTGKRRNGRWPRKRCVLPSGHSDGFPVHRRARSERIPHDAPLEWYDVVRANDVFGEATDDRRILEYCAEEGHVLITHDKKDFGGSTGEAVDHAGIVIYTDPLFLRTDPAGAVRTLDRVFEAYSEAELAGERVWLDQWRERV